MERYRIHLRQNVSYFFSFIYLIVVLVNHYTYIINGGCILGLRWSLDDPKLGEYTCEGFLWCLLIFGGFLLCLHQVFDIVFVRHISASLYMILSIALLDCFNICRYLLIYAQHSLTDNNKPTKYSTKCFSE